jgi:hypothetical protein
MVAFTGWTGNFSITGHFYFVWDAWGFSVCDFTKFTDLTHYRKII